MRSEFQRGLVFQSDLDEIARGLRQTANAEYQQKLQRIDSELAACKLIQLGLSEPRTSEANKVANSFMIRFRAAHEGELKQNKELLKQLNQIETSEKRKKSKPKPQAPDDLNDVELMQPPIIDDV